MFKCPKFNPDNNEIGVIPINKTVSTWQETRIEQDFKIFQIVLDMFAMWESIFPKKGLSFKRLWKTKNLPNMICHFRNLRVTHPRSEIGEIPINKIVYTRQEALINQNVSDWLNFISCFLGFEFSFSKEVKSVKRIGCTEMFQICLNVYEYFALVYEIVLTSIQAFVFLLSLSEYRSLIQQRLDKRTSIKTCHGKLDRVRDRRTQSTA